MKLRLPFAFFFLCVHLISFSQDTDTWGKLTADEIALKTCFYDSSASAVMLSDRGMMNIGYGKIIIERHRKIKILNKSAFSKANVTLPYFAKNQMEKIETIEAQILTPTKDGKVTITKVPSSQIFEVDVTENWREKRFTFPNVEVGSILEYRYRLSSTNNAVLDPWLFQSDIPTLHSELTANILSSSVRYRILLFGSRLTTQYPPGKDLQLMNWSLDNLEALSAEPYANNPRDYAEKIQFQLTGYLRHTSSGLIVENIETNWDKLAKDLLKDSDFYIYLHRGGKVKDIIKQITTPREPDLVKVQKIYDYVRTHYQWNGKHWFFPHQRFGDFLDSKQGNSAEINLFLTLLLQEADLLADPVLLSTRSHGKIQQTYAQLSQFNHLLAHVTIDGQSLLLNATDRLRPYTLLDKEDLNNTGFLLDTKESRWIKITPFTHSKETLVASMDLKDIQKPVCGIRATYEGYEALDTQKIYISLGEQKFVEQQQSLLGQTLVKFIPEQSATVELGINHSYTLELEDLKDQNGIIYFRPVVWHHFHENPFKDTKRRYPIELEYPGVFEYTLTLPIPAGYRLQEIPKPLDISLPNNLATFRYQATADNSVVHLSTRVEFKSTTIHLAYYRKLQDFYNQIIGKYQEMIVLSKVSPAK
jgi:hypothetical protein